MLGAGELGASVCKRLFRRLDGAGVGWIVDLLQGKLCADQLRLRGRQRSLGGGQLGGRRTLQQLFESEPREIELDFGCFQMALRVAAVQTGEGVACRHIVADLNFYYGDLSSDGEAERRCLRGCCRSGEFDRGRELASRCGDPLRLEHRRFFLGPGEEPGQDGRHCDRDDQQQEDPAARTSPTAYQGIDVNVLSAHSRPASSVRRVVRYGERAQTPAH